jgi:predicted aspartyl protease
MAEHIPKALSYPFPGFVEYIYTPIELFSGPYDRARSLERQALWDTGAMISVVTPDVARKLKLKKHDEIVINGFGGEELVDVVLVSLKFPNGITIERFDVVVSNVDPDAGIIIGMDIITQLDFAITNGGGQTTFSFAIPPFENKFDFSRWDKN